MVRRQKGGYGTTGFIVAAFILTIVNIALIYISIWDNRKLRQAMETHLDACRRIRASIIPVTSLDHDALAKIDEHIDAINKTNARIEEILNDYNVHRQRHNRLNRNNKERNRIGVPSDTNDKDARLHQGEEEHHENRCCEADADNLGAQTEHSVLGETNDQSNEVYGDDISC